MGDEAHGIMQAAPVCFPKLVHGASWVVRRRFQNMELGNTIYRDYIEITKGLHGDYIVAI